MQKGFASRPLESVRLRIALGVPEWQPFYQVMSGEPADATYVIQGYLARGLKARGYDLTFIAPNNLDDVVCTNEPQKLEYAPRTWSASRWFDIASKGAWRIQQVLGIPYLNVFSNYRFYDACLQCLPGHDLVYERNGLYNAGLAMACKRLKIPYVIFFEADQIMEFDLMGTPITGWLRWRANQILRHNLKAARCIICVSEGGKAHLINKWSIPAEKIVVFPNAVDVHRFRPDPEAKADVRASLGIESQPLVIFVGNFFHWHDVSTLLDAFAQLLAAYPAARLVLVGDGAQREVMRQRATDLGMSHAVHFTGLVPHAEVPRFVAAADVAVVPYPAMKQELWLSPLKLFEYMASGTAVVASGVGQLLQVVRDGCNGILVPPGDASAMAAALQRLLADAALRTRLGQQARQDAVQKYSWETYIAHLEQVYTTVIAGQPVN
jgi:starch synthase